MRYLLTSTSQPVPNRVLPCNNLVFYFFLVHETHLRIEILNARHLKPLETQRVHQTTVPSTSSTTISKLPNHSTRSTSSTTLSRPLTSTCLSSPDYQGQDHQHEFSHKATDTLINEVKIRI